MGRPINNKNAGYCYHKEIYWLLALSRHGSRPRKTVIYRKSWNICLKEENAGLGKPEEYFLVEASAGYVHKIQKLLFIRNISCKIEVFWGRNGCRLPLGRR